MPAVSKRRFSFLRTIITVLFLGGIGVILQRNAHALSSSIRVVSHASVGGVAIATGLISLTYFIAAGMYQLLALHTLQFGRTITIEVASSAANRILPAGVGGLGLLGVYLYKNKHSPAQATAVIAMNNLLGIGAHLLLLATASLIVPSIWQTFSKRLDVHLTWLPFAVLLIVGILSFVPFIRDKLRSFLENLFVSLKLYSHKPLRIFSALVLAMLLTVTLTAILFVTTKSLHLFLSPVDCFVIFSIGMLAATATPTPGGLIGAEAGLFAGFTAYGISSSNALAATLLFRLLAYWLPVIPGIGALILSRHKRWI